MKTNIVTGLRKFFGKKNKKIAKHQGTSDSDIRKYPLTTDDCYKIGVDPYKVTEKF